MGKMRQWNWLWEKKAGSSRCKGLPDAEVAGGREERQGEGTVKDGNQAAILYRWRGGRCAA